MSLRWRDLASGELLRRHVGGRAGADVVDASGHGRETEVGQADVAVAVDHHVGRLEIAMQHATFVRRRDPGANLPRDLDRLLLRKAADAVQQRRQILPVHVLHRQERAAVGVADVVGAADVAVGDGARDADLVVELREARRVVHQFIGKQLERDRLSELEILGAVDLAHAAAAERGDDAEAAGEEGAGGEAPPACTAGRGQR